MKTSSSLSIFGKRKEHFSSYLAEFMWCYKHKDHDMFKVFFFFVTKNNFCPKYSADLFHMTDTKYSLRDKEFAIPLDLTRLHMASIPSDTLALSNMESNTQKYKRPYHIICFQAAY